MMLAALLAAFAGHAQVVEDDDADAPMTEAVGDEPAGEPLVDYLTGDFSTLPAYDPWALCPPYAFPTVDLDPLLPTDQPEALAISADRAEAVGEEVAIFEGNVTARRGEQEFAADSVRYDQAQDTLDAQGDVRYRMNGLFLSSEQAHLDLGREQGELSPVEYHLSGRHAFGGAAMVRIHSPERMDLRQATYTTCVPDKVDWQLRARDIRLDQASGQGEARNVLLQFKRVPILYLPYVRFPITDQRMSGFLYPDFGSSSRHGTELSIPYYWNIAPHRDATITINSLSRRGVLLENEFRYLNRNSSGEIYLDYLPDDNVYGDDRMRASIVHRGSPAPRWRTSVNYSYVSDEEYLLDFGGDLGSASTTHLQRIADVSYRADDWTFAGRLEDYQALFGEPPYRRVPQLTLRSTLPEQDFRPVYRLQSEFVRFDHPTKTLVGNRLDVETGIAYPMRGAPAFLVPQLTLRHTQYDLEGVAPGAEIEPSRTVPIFSVDSGIFLERDTAFGDTPLLHTLEPRLFYLYVPYRDQTALPVFDTTEADLTFTQLFRENRFVGADRVGDTNQLTMAVTSRLIDAASGVERVSGSLGQIYYFDDRQVALRGEREQTELRSDLLALVGTRLTRSWSADGELRWDPEEEERNLTAARLQYRPANDRVLNLSYRFRRDELEQTDVSAAWPLGPRWSAVGRWNYSLLDEQTLESFVGVRYESCCWAARLVGRRYLRGLGLEQADFDRSIFLELELKGLSSIGRRGPIEELLQHGILGYRPTP